MEEQFATWYHIPIATLRHWEQGASSARPYLTVTGTNRKA
jgi:DNA-binding transcriptional regulator YiaG